MVRFDRVSTVGLMSKFTNRPREPQPFSQKDTAYPIKVQVNPYANPISGKSLQKLRGEGIV